ncbi:MAG: hypothetical protein AAFZ52_20050, partial [Bacteroidota bacterium]
MSAIIIPVLAAHRHPRLRYVLSEVGQDLGYRLRLFTEFEQWAAFDAPGRVVYGDAEVVVKAVHWPAHPLLTGQSPTPDLWDGSATDLLAAIFYALSRYEEYENFTPDIHGRFPAAASKAYQHGYLHRPVVRKWTARLGRSLLDVFPNLPPPTRPAFTFRPTYDIDLPWAWRYRGLRGWGAGLRDVLTGQFSRAWQRITVRQEGDPYATLALIRSWHPRTRPHIFWLLADNTDRRDP